MSRGVDGKKRTAYTIAAFQFFMLSYADDLVLLAPSPMELQALLIRLQTFCTANSLNINIAKTKAMFVNCDVYMSIWKSVIETV